MEKRRGEHVRKVGTRHRLPVHQVAAIIGEFQKYLTGKFRGFQSPVRQLNGDGSPGKAYRNEEGDEENEKNVDERRDVDRRRSIW